MNSVVRRVLFCLILITLALPIFSCHSQKKNSSSTSITIWHWMTDREDFFRELATRYLNETGVEVKFQLYAADYQQKVRVGAQTGSLPEIFGVMGSAEDIARFVEAEHLYDMSPALGSGPGSWKERFFQEALKSAYFKRGNEFGVSPGYYGIPLDVATIPMIMNKKLFDHVGLDSSAPPATWEEFIQVGNTLRQKGFVGFVAGWGEGWLLYSMVTNLAHNVMPASQVMDTFRGKVPYTDPRWVRVFSAFEDMRKAGFTDPSLVSLKNKNAEKKFASERSGMTFNGSWTINVFDQMNAGLDYTPFATPALDPKGPRVVWGGPGVVFSVNAKSPLKDEAVKFLEWMTLPDQAAYLLVNTKNIPSVKDVDREIPPLLTEYARLMEGSIHPNRFPVSEDPRVTEVLIKGVQSILIAEKSPKKVAEEIQKMKSKVMKEKV